MADVWTPRPERPGSAADRRSVRQVELAAFDTPAEADLVDALRGDPGRLDGLSYLAEAPSSPMPC